MSRVELPSGEWAELRDPDTIKAGDRKRVIIGMGDVDTMAASIYQTMEAVLSLSIEKWSFDRPIPSEDPHSLDELSIPDWDALAEAAKPIEQALFPDFSIKVDGGKLVEGSPT